MLLTDEGAQYQRGFQHAEAWFDIRTVWVLDTKKDGQDHISDADV